ncbi:MAG: hypothetical protein QM638_21050 [Nocardioides sp.]|uniref:hypothetical protein n=1 Tax=Nocardioides sp. TaxID=35761 RepID=UPI0039E48462
MSSDEIHPSAVGVSALPDDAILVHLGPYKTGTTALQASLAQHRDDLAAHGVLYPGPRRHHHEEVWALRGRSTTGHSEVPLARWHQLVEQVRAHRGRVVISSEFLAGTGREHIGKLVEDLGRDRVHAVMTIRRLISLLPSDWQEKVKTHGFTQPYQDWLAEVIEPAGDTRAARDFWHLYGVTNLMSRWKGLVGADRVVTIVSDDTDREQGPRTFEALLGLPNGLLTPAAEVTKNASLTEDRIELLRQVNLAFERQGWSDRELRLLVHRGLLTGLRQPVARELGSPMPVLPAWASPRLERLSDERADAVATSGTTVVGDPDRLRLDTAATATPLGPWEPPEVIGIQAAAGGIEATIAAAIRRANKPTGRVRQETRETPSGEPLDRAPASALIREVARRGRRRLGRVVRPGRA